MGKYNESRYKRQDETSMLDLNEGIAVMNGEDIRIQKQPKKDLDPKNLFPDSSKSVRLIESNRYNPIDHYDPDNSYLARQERKSEELPNGMRIKAKEEIFNISGLEYNLD